MGTRLRDAQNICLLTKGSAILNVVAPTKYNKVNNTKRKLLRLALVV